MTAHRMTDVILDEPLPGEWADEQYRIAVVGRVFAFRLALPVAPPSVEWVLRPSRSIAEWQGTQCQPDLPGRYACTLRVGAAPPRTLRLVAVDDAVLDWRALRLVTSGANTGAERTLADRLRILSAALRDPEGLDPVRFGIALEAGDSAPLAGLDLARYGG